MALINCPECAKEVSDKAKTCPHCGVDVQKETKEFIYGHRRCTVCGYEGEIQTWYLSSIFPWFATIVGLLFFFIPGLIFWFWAWGRRVCPNCKTVGKSIPVTRS